MVSHSSDPILFPFYALGPMPALTYAEALTLYFAYFASQSRHVIVNLNFPDLLNFPKHVPIAIKFGLETEVARCMVLTGR